MKTVALVLVLCCGFSYCEDKSVQQLSAEVEDLKRRVKALEEENEKLKQRVWEAVQAVQAAPNQADDRYPYTIKSITVVGVHGQQAHCLTLDNGARYALLGPPREQAVLKAWDVGDGIRLEEQPQANIHQRELYWIASNKSKGSRLLYLLRIGSEEVKK